MQAWKLHIDSNGADKPTEERLKWIWSRGGGCEGADKSWGLFWGSDTLQCEEILSAFYSYNLNIQDCCTAIVSKHKATAQPALCLNALTANLMQLLNTSHCFYLAAFFPTASHHLNFFLANVSSLNNSNCSSISDIEKKVLNSILSVIAACRHQHLFISANNTEDIFHPSFPMTHCHWWQTA